MHAPRYAAFTGFRRKAGKDSCELLE